MRLFLYGTLMQGEPNHGQVRGLPCLGAALTFPTYTLYDLGPYPALAEGGSTAVAGELYEVPDALLPVLDAFEGVPSLYQRVAIALSSGGPAEAYLMPATRLAGYPEVPGGDWRTRPDLLR